MQVALKASVEAEFALVMGEGRVSTNKAALVAVKNVGTAQESAQTA